MRSHGVANFPDPDAQGQFPPFHSDSAASKQASLAANDACKGLLVERRRCRGPPQDRQEKFAFALKVARCLRSHGFPNFPDPPNQNLSGTGIDPNSTQFQAAETACENAGAESARPAMSSSFAAPIVVAAGLALLAAGCGGSPRSHVAQLGATATQSSSTRQPPASTLQGDEVAFARCMRSHGVPKYPDPTAAGLVKESVAAARGQQLRFQTAQSACRHLLPNGGSPPSPARVQQVRALSLHFAQCVRSHGVPSFPDPGSDGRIPDPATVGINQGSPKFEAANQACRKYRPPYMPSNAAYNAYARAHGG